MTVSVYEVTKLIHLVAAIVWMGSMTFMLFALRPAALATLEAQPRARLMADVMRRFFLGVALAVVALFFTGMHLYTAGFRAARAALGSGSAPLGWNVMLVLGLIMMLIFGHIYFAGSRKFRRAVTGEDWPIATQAAAQIHRLVVINFTLGWIAIVAVRLLR